MSASAARAHPYSVCVYCGSRHGARESYRAAAEAVGRGLAAQGMRLVYGAGDVGLMGEVARAAGEAGGQTFGVIPRHLEALEVGRRELTAYVVTETMHERKKVMLMNADAVVALPGGAGTLDELFEALTWRQLGLHDKPVLLLNTEFYWDPLLRLNEHVVAEGMAGESFLDLYETVPDATALLARLEALAQG